ncbi:sulfatase-like hydrolase/transferase [Natrinema longum]|uniref:Sulfatase-like hydrolase/transferase n=1 Tax=Natrinema longum TaxID=370324 RepID=A0A8A2UDU7_9EURY|nr:sulfatase-like hydrolase/transferase [Natrinema longum]MBZ6495385.1 sulfatase-like hydrolase/transferase [Natrinema longum]QSW86642.1 sulfatase-like hydrolase/transferase [Natrinema longum]
MTDPDTRTDRRCLEPEQDLDDVILITVDSWRADYCGFMGGPDDLTPTLDSLAEDGLVFENAIAPAPETNSSVATMLTGQYQNPSLESDGTDYTECTRNHMRTRRSLPQRFGELGYETAAFTANPWTSRYFDFDHDFDHFEDFMEQSLSAGFVDGGADQRGLIGDVAAQLANWYQGQDMFMNWEAFYGDVRAWLDGAESPYFLWLFLVDVHMPYFPPSGYRSRSRLLTYPANASLFAGQHELPFESVFRDVLVDSYEDSIRYTDEFFGQLTADVGGDPLIAITGDHGEAFGENGVYGHGPEVSEEMLHVPFVVANGPDETVERPFSLRDLPRLLPRLATGATFEDLLDTTVWARNYDPAVAIRGRDWRFEWRPDEQHVEVLENGEWERRRVPELELLGRELLESHIEAERERGRVLDAVDSLAAEAAL